MNIFSNTIQYALRALRCLGQLALQETILGRDLAKRIGVPANYLSKVLLTLGKAGIVEATRGLGGGYRLKRPPEEIALAEVIHLFEPLHQHPVCFLDSRNECSAEDPCPAHESWHRVRTDYLDFIHNTTLAALSRPVPETVTKGESP